jgi:hypothetical protein
MVVACGRGSELIGMTMTPPSFSRSLPPKEIGKGSTTMVFAYGMALAPQWILWVLQTPSEGQWIKAIS